MFGHGVELFGLMNVIHWPSGHGVDAVRRRWWRVTVMVIVDSHGF